MKIEEVIKSTVALDNDHKIILNIMYTENLINESFNEILKPYEISGEQYNVLRILRGQKGNPANMSMIQERMTLLQHKQDWMRVRSPRTSHSCSRFLSNLN